MSVGQNEATLDLEVLGALFAVKKRLIVAPGSVFQVRYLLPENFFA